MSSEPNYIVDTDTTPLNEWLAEVQEIAKRLEEVLAEVPAIPITIQIERED